MARDPITLPPQAARTIEGLRDTGYEPADALEDIIDNCIAADATRIVVRVWMGPEGSPVVTIADNGSGMDESGLLNAMTYGAAVRASKASLGKFGLGLKTASTAMCRQLTVVSRPESSPDASAAMWDLDYVREQNEWLLQRPDPTGEQLELLDEVAEQKNGTVVMWRKVDRLIREYTNPSGPYAKQAIEEKVREFRDSLSLTYLRYLRGDAPYRQITIEVNDVAVEPWDPFDQSFPAEVLVSKSPTVRVNVDGVEHEASFRLVAYALPPRSELTSEQLQKAKITTRNQGFYVFREGRLLAKGTWLGLRSVEPHLNLCRIDFSFDHQLDEAFQIDIKKSRILLHADLQRSIGEYISSAVAEAQKRYRKNQRSEAVASAGDLHRASNTIIQQNKQGLVTTTVTPEGPGSASVTNSRGTTLGVSIQVLDDSASKGPYVLVQDSLDDGMLWEPGIVKEEHAVLLNAGHPFYQRVYMPNRGNGTAIQGMDFLFWALCQAEWGVLTDDERMHMQAVRQIVTRLTRRLASELPEVTTEE